MDDYTESQKKIITTAHTAVAFVVIVALVALVAWFVLKGLSIASRAVMPAATGLFLALFFKPYYLWLEKKVKIPIVALLLLVVTVLLPIVLIAWWVGATVVNEIVGLVKQMPEMMGQALDWIGSSFPSLHVILERVKVACGWLADAIVSLVREAPPVDASTAEASCDQVAGALVNYGDVMSNAVTSTQNVDATVSGVAQAGEQAISAAVSAVSTNCDVSAVQTAVGGVNLNTERLSELYATYGDQIKKFGTDVIQAGYDKFGHAAADGGGVAAAAATSTGTSSVSAESGKLGWVYAGASGVVMKIGSGVVGTLQGLFYMLVTAIFFVYFLMKKNFSGGRIAGAIPMLKDKTREIVANQIDTLINILVSFYQRQVLICLVEGCFYGIGFWLVGLPYGFLIGLMLGTLNIIPFFGSIVCLPLALAFAYFGLGGSGLKVALVLLVWGIGQFLDGYFITPKIQGDKTGLGYAGVIFSFLLWTMFLGPMLGMLLAIPLSACCVVVWRTFCKLTRSSGIL